MSLQSFSKSFVFPHVIHRGPLVYLQGNDFNNLALEIIIFIVVNDDLLLMRGHAIAFRFVDGDLAAQVSLSVIQQFSHSSIPAAHSATKTSLCAFDR